MIDGKEYELESAPYDTQYKRTIKAKSGVTPDLEARFICRDTQVMDALSMGDFVSVYLEKKAKKNVLCVPKDAILRDGSSRFVVRVKDGIQEKVFVETGMENAYETEILSGVSKGDVVALQSVYFETKQTKEVALTRSQMSWNDQVNVVSVYMKYAKALYSKLPSARIDTIYVKEGEMVKKGDLLIKLEIPSNQSEIDRLKYRLETLQKDEDNELLQITKEQNKVNGRREELRQSNPEDSQIAVYDKQIAYFEQMKEYTKAQYEYQRLLTQAELDGWLRQQDLALIRAECDGEFCYMEKDNLNRTISQGDILAYVMPKGMRTFSIPKKNDILYGQKVSISIKGVDTYNWSCTALYTENTKPGWYDTPYYGYDTVLGLDEGEIDVNYIQNGIATYPVRSFKNCYLLTPEMVYEDKYGSFVYVLQEEGRVKQYVTLTPFHDNVAVVLDGISEDCVVLSK